MKVSLKEYRRIHSWISRTYGKADLCESSKCPEKCKYFTWALKKGWKHQQKRRAYKKLCLSCHMRYDKKNNLVGKVEKGASRYPWVKRWRAKRKGYGANKMLEYRNYYRALYRKRKISYDDIPISYRSFTRAYKKLPRVPHV